jgi:hypothetical protein
MVNELTQKIDLSQKSSKEGEKDFGSHLHPNKVYAASARDLSKERRDNIVHMFACNTPST